MASLSSGRLPDGSSVLDILSSGHIEIEGRMPWSSNGTFLSTVTVAADGGEVAIPAIYKPWQAERPLWDFTHGLFRREIAAYELAVRLGWQLVPETVRREEGPL